MEKKVADILKHDNVLSGQDSNSAVENSERKKKRSENQMKRGDH